jgi:hypothetical protein
MVKVGLENEYCKDASQPAKVEKKQTKQNKMQFP